jgi:tetratricopeptide (TPR) repeat protein
MTIAICFSAYTIPVFAEDSIDSMNEQAWNQFQKENYQDAAVIYQQINDKYEKAGTKQEDREPFVYYNLGECYYQLNDAYGAIAAYEEAKNLFTDDNDRLMRIYYRLGEEYNSIGNYEKALAVANIAFKCPGTADSFDLYLVCGDAMEALGQYDEAEKYYQKFAEVSPENEAYVNDLLGKLEEIRKNYDKAIAYYQKIIDETDDQYKGSYTEKIVNCIGEKSEGDLDAAVKKYMIDGLKADDITVADFYFNNGYYDRAVQYYDKVLKTDKKNIDATYWRAMAFYNTEKYTDAINGFEAAYKIDPTYQYSMEYISDCYMDMSDYDNALKTLTVGKVDENTAANIKFWINMYKSDPEEAMKAVEPLVGKDNTTETECTDYINGKKDITMNDVIATYARLEDFPADEYQQADYIINHINDGHFTQKSFDSYEMYLKKMSEKYPEDYTILNEYASILSANGKYADAITVYEQAKKADSYRTAGIINKQIGVYVKLGEPVNAVRLAQAAAKSFTDHPEFSEWEAIIDYKKMNDPDGAIAIYQKLLSKYSDNTGYMGGMMRAYDLKKDYASVIKYADEILKESPNDKYALAYKARALTELHQDGADAIISQIDAMGNAGACDSEQIEVDSILGRNDKVVSRLSEYLKNHPEKDNVQTLVDGYDMRYALTDKEIAGMLGVKPLNLGTALWQNPMVTGGVTVAGLVILSLGILLNVRAHKRAKKINECE